MIIQPTKICGVNIVYLEKTYYDHRGKFRRLFCNDILANILGGRKIIQINYSCTNKIGTIRGLHFQYPPYAEMKMIQVIRGKVWDVAVDLRAGSKTFLQWHAEELSPDTPKIITIPEGCAHGFQVLDSNTELLYFHTALYQPKSEGGVRFNDKVLGIKWPLHPVDLSLRDLQYQDIDASFEGIFL